MTLHKRLTLLIATSVALLLAPLAWSHVPVPDSVLNPQTPAEAWNVLRLSTANVERLLREGRLAEIPDQISLCSPALRALPKNQGPRTAEQTVRAAVAISSLAQASVAGDRAMAASTLATLGDLLAKLASAYDPKVAQAEIYFCPMHPDVVSADSTLLCPKCGMLLLRRRIPYSFIFVPAGETTLQLTARADHDPTAGQPTQVTVRLARRDGSPVLLPDLLVTHTQPIHLLIVDPALEDYHHEHPKPTGVPGQYAFSFTPTKTGAYRIFADVAPADSGVQEYPFTDLSAPAVPVPVRNRPSTYISNAGGLIFRLTLEQTDGSPPRAGQARSLRIAVTGADGKPFTGLEPVMSAFAHLVGFYDDYRTVVHLHPAGAEALDPNARGGPELDFKFYPPKAGFVRLFCQVRVNGRMIFAPFDLNVAP